MNKEFEKRFKLFIAGLNSNEFKTKIAKAIIKKLYGRIKTGKGVNNDVLPPEQTKAVPLQPLSKSYKDYRGGKVRFFTRKDGVVMAYKPKQAPMMHSTASANKSNLTFSGQMLESLAYEVGKEIRIFIPNTPRTDENGFTTDLSNSEVAALVSLHRPFLAITDSEMKVIERMYKDEINRLIRRLF